MNEKKESLQAYHESDRIATNEWKSYSRGLTNGQHKSYIIKYAGRNRKEDDGTMSFVGIILLEKAAIAFGDSKSTVMDEVGMYRQQAGRIVQKVFRYGDRLLVASGNNEVIMTRIDFDGKEPREHKESIYLEDFINDAIRKEYAISDMADELVRKERMSKSGHEYKFMECWKENEDFYIREFSVNENGIHLQPKNKQDDYSIIGYVISRNINDCYSIWMKQYAKEAKKKHIDENPEAFVENFRNALEREIKKVDGEVCYNPVGLPLQFEILKL